MFPDEIYEIIIGFLPLKNLFRFRSVCSSFKNIIDNLNPKFFVENGDRDVYLEDIPFFQLSILRDIQEFIPIL